MNLLTFPIKYKKTKSWSWFELKYNFVLVLVYLIIYNMLTTTKHTHTHTLYNSKYDVADQQWLIYNLYLDLCVYFDGKEFKSSHFYITVFVFSCHK